jgi:hypothetical protein
MPDFTINPVRSTFHVREYRIVSVDLDKYYGRVFTDHDSRGWIAVDVDDGEASGFTNKHRAAAHLFGLGGKAWKW